MNLRLLAIGMTTAVALAGCASTSPGYGSSGYGGDGGGGVDTAPPRCPAVGLPGDEWSGVIRLDLAVIGPDSSSSCTSDNRRHLLQ